METRESAGQSRPGDQASGDLPPPPALRIAEQTSVFLDFDGTLVEIAEHPDAVRVPPELPASLAALAARLDGRLAVVSGRSLAVLDRLIGSAGIAMAGSHGGEFRPAGAHQVQPLAEPLPPAVAQEVERFAQARGGLVFEAKPFSVAVHYRQRPDCGPALDAFAAGLARDHGMALKHGKMVVELTMPGSDKGSALTHFMALAPFAGTRPLFLGDDVTDEDAFATVGRFAGAGVLVGPMRATRAIWRLEDVAAVHRWLEASA